MSLYKYITYVNGVLGLGGRGWTGGGRGYGDKGCGIGGGGCGIGGGGGGVEGAGSLERLGREIDFL